MRRQARPFTVEIKSSHKSVSIRKPVSSIPDRPRTEPLPQDLLLKDAREPLQVRSPAQEAALSKAHSVFRRLDPSASGPAQSFARLRIVPKGPEREAFAPAEPRTAEPAEPRQARILPGLSRAERLPNPEAEKRPAAPRKPRTSSTQERIEPETETLPG